MKAPIHFPQQHERPRTSRTPPTLVSLSKKRLPHRKSGPASVYKFRHHSARALPFHRRSCPRCCSAVCASWRDWTASWKFCRLRETSEVEVGCVFFVCLRARPAGSDDPTRSESREQGIRHNIVDTMVSAGIPSSKYPPLPHQTRSLCGVKPALSSTFAH